MGARRRPLLLPKFALMRCREAPPPPVEADVPAGLGGVVFHGLTRGVPEDRLEAPEVMAEAAYALCSGDPAVLTGKVAYARPLLGGPLL